MRILFFSFLVSVFFSSYTYGQSQKKVLIIGIDGCRSDALQIATTPNLDNLISNGIYSPDALNDDITISGPGWSANLCGVWSNKHLVTSNSFGSNDYANYPPVFKYINDFNAALHTVSICNWNPINDEIVQNHADFKLNVNSDVEVRDQAANYLSLNDPDFMFLHFDDVDHAGHGYGFSPIIPEYISAIEVVDGYLYPIVQAILQRPNYSNEDWLILVTTDHGGLGFSHGGNSDDEQNVFVIASGNSIPTQIIYKDSSVVIDSAFNCLGDSVMLEFDGNNDFVQVPSNSIFDFGSSQDFTIECRVRTNNTGDVAIVGNKDWFSGSNQGFVFSFKYPSGPEWKVNIGDGTNRADINTGGFIADDQWHTLSVSFDRDGYMKMYEDGVLLDSADISNVGDVSTGQGLFFGADINAAYD
ncbi:MAG: alkaline phosphatase family protein, partial [Rhodobacterales bacterium]